MSLVTGILAGIQGITAGAAEAALREDEKRREDSKAGMKVILKNREYALNLAKEQNEKIKEENEAVKSIVRVKNPVTGKPFTKEEAVALYQTAKASGDNPLEVINKYKVVADKEAKLVESPGTKYDILGKSVPEPVGEPTGGILSRGRHEAVKKDLLEQMAASGIETSVAIPSSTEVTGVSVTPITDVNVDYSNEYIIDENGIPTQQVLAIRTRDPITNNVTVKYLDKVSGKELKLDSSVKVSTAADAFREQTSFTDFGPLMTIGADGTPELIRDKRGNVVSGYLMKTGEIRTQQAGKVSESVYVAPEGKTVLIAGKHFSESLAGGDLSSWGKMFKFPPVKIFHESLPEMDITVKNNNLLFNRSQKRLDLHQKYGNSMYGFEGGFATMVTGLSKNIQGIGNVILGLSGLDTSGMSEEQALRAKVRYLESDGNISRLKNFIKREEELMSQGFVDKQKEIAMAKVLDSAIATVTAYDLAKQTGDTRISNADFDAYISTVTGNNAAETINLIKNGLDDNLVIYTSLHDNIIRSRDRIPTVEELKPYQESFDKALSTVPSPEVYQQRFNTMFKPFEKQDEVITIKTDDFDIMPVETDAQGNKIRKVVMKDGREFPLRNPRFFDADEETIRAAIQKRLQAEAAAKPN